MNIGFRIDSSFKIGSGHLTRTLCLAKYLYDRGNKCHFFCRNLKGNLNHLICSPFIFHELSSASGYYDRSGPMHSDWLEHSPIDDAHEINSLIQKNKIDILIVDHYALDKTWEEIIYPKIKKLVVMDDLNDREHYCHILANLNFGAENIFPIKVNIDAKKLLGTKYLLINPDFLNFKTKRVRKKLKKVLLFFGGVDNEEYTEKFIEKNYFNKFPELQFNLLSRKPGHKKWENHFKNLTAHINSNNIPELMFNSDLYIGSGGTITTERLYMGLPGLIVCVAKNQEVTNQSLFTENLGKKINFPNDSESIIEILRDLIKQPDWLASTSKKCYDIYSPYSLENFIFEILN